MGRRQIARGRHVPHLRRHRRYRPGGQRRERRLGRAGRDELPDPGVALRRRDSALRAERGSPLMPPATFESPELVDLFTTYTARPDSIGAHLAQVTAMATERDPLLVVTGTDLALYRGGGAPPVIEPYRLATRGFKELAGISHLGPALATLARLRELASDESGGDASDHVSWRTDAARLLDATKAARAASSIPLWRDQIEVRAFAGREESI